MSRIIIVSELFYPDGTSTAHILTKIADHLHSDNNDILVISSSKSYSSDNIKDTFNIAKPYEIKRIQIRNYDKNKITSRVLRVIITSLKLGGLLWKSSAKDDQVLIVTNPAPFIILASIIKRIRGFKLNILVHDVFPDNTIAAGIIQSNRNFLYRSLNILFSRAYCTADRIIVIGRDMKEIFNRKFSGKKKIPSIEIIENWADPLPADFKIKSNKENKLNILYAGNFGRCQGLVDFIEIFGDANNHNIRLCLRGGGAMLPEIETRVKNSDADIVLGGSFYRDEQFNILNDCDIALVTLADGMYGLGVPSKSYNIMAAGKPILFIGDLNSEIALTIQEHNLGYCFDPSDKIGIREWLMKLHSEIRSDLKKMGTNAFNLTNSIYSEKTILTKYSQLFSSDD